MAKTYQEVVKSLGVATRLIGFFQGVQTDTKEYDGKSKEKSKLVLACGTALVQVGFDPSKYGFTLPPAGAVVQLLCESGIFNGKAFYNNPGQAVIIADENGVVLEKPSPCPVKGQVPTARAA